MPASSVTGGTRMTCVVGLDARDRFNGFFKVAKRQQPSSRG
jgi:hypothetical protein